MFAASQTGQFSYPVVSVPTLAGLTSSSSVGLSGFVWIDTVGGLPVGMILSTNLVMCGALRKYSGAQTFSATGGGFVCARAKVMASARTRIFMAESRRVHAASGGA